MHDERPNPYAHKPITAGPPDSAGDDAPASCRGQWAQAVRTMGLAVALMVATIAAMTAVFFLESRIRGEAAGAFWDDLRDAAWLPILFVGCLPALTRRGGNRCCLFRGR